MYSINGDIHKKLAFQCVHSIGNINIYIIYNLILNYQLFLSMYMKTFSQRELPNIDFITNATLSHGHHITAV